MAECDGCAGDIDETATGAKTDLLARVEPGDIFHARSPNGTSLICLAISVDGRSISARRITSQEDFAFDLQTGLELNVIRGRACWIDSVEPLPVDMHNVLIGMDRRYRLGRDLSRLRLTDAEKTALLFVGSHYDNHPIQSAGLIEESTT